MYSDIHWTQIADKVRDELPVRLPKAVVRLVVRSMLSRIFKILQRRRSKIVFYGVDIHTIYYEQGRAN